jgi:predicted RNA binding protein YcfA (HicA-like mRNA interferase family)
MPRAMKVRDIIRLVEQDGWYSAYTRGSHRNFLHPTKSGKVTIPGHPSDTLPPKTVKSIFDQAQMEAPK